LVIHLYLKFVQHCYNLLHYFGKNNANMRQWKQQQVAGAKLTMPVNLAAIATLTLLAIATLTLLAIATLTLLAIATLAMLAMLAIAFKNRHQT